MTPILFIGIGILMAILWIDLKFDWLAVPYRGKMERLSEDVLAPMAYYYRYVTGKPIVIAMVMLSMMIAIILEIVQGTVPAWVAWASLLVFGTAITRSAILVIPTCRRFGKRTDSIEKQTSTAHAMLGMHLFAFACVLTLAILQLSVFTAIMMNMVLFTCIGFLAGFVWINIKFDWIAVPYRNKPGILPEEVLVPMTLFYRHLKSAIQLAVVMIFILLIFILEIVQGMVSPWVAWGCLILFAITMTRSLLVVIPSARRLAARTDSLEKQTSLAHGMLPMHLLAFTVALILAGLQLYSYYTTLK